MHNIQREYSVDTPGAQYSDTKCQAGGTHMLASSIFSRRNRSLCSGSARAVTLNQTMIGEHFGSKGRFLYKHLVAKFRDDYLSRTRAYPYAHL